MTILEIGNTDLSQFVNKRRYVVNQEDETTSWKDANSVIHTTVLRTRVKASIELVFTSETEHNSFLSVLNSECVDGYWEVSLYVNNIHMQKTITARIEHSATPIFGNALVEERPVVNSIKLEIVEV